MSALPLPSLSPEEYLRRERLARERSEYHRGRLVAMAGASPKHIRIVTNATIALGIQLRDRPCRIYTNELRVSVRGGEYYLYPDLAITCGREIFEGDRRDTLLNPIVIIEVLSPSTEAYDRGEKFLAYQSIPSLREYVLIAQSPPRFEIYRRRDDGTWSYQSWAFHPPTLVLESIGCTLDPEDVYRKVEDEGN